MEWMIFRNGDNDALAPDGKRFSVPPTITFRNECDVDRSVSKIRHQMIATSIDKIHPDVRKTAVMLNQCGPKIPSRKGSMDTNNEAAAFTPRSCL